MLLDSNILIYAANQTVPEIEALVVSGDNGVASVTPIEVYGFTGLKPEEKAALDILFRRLTVHPLDTAVIDRAIALRQESRMGTSGRHHRRYGPGAWLGTGDAERGRLQTRQRAATHQSV